MTVQVLNNQSGKRICMQISGTKLDFRKNILLHSSVMIFANQTYLIQFMDISIQI